MPRWEHGSRERLKQAAVELFGEQGYEKTSVIEIARRAGVTTRTFFRYFADKREVLFDGPDEIRAALIGKILEAPDVSAPLALVVTVLGEFDWESFAPREGQRLRQAVIDANPALLERDLIKHNDIAVGMIDALQRRGIGAEVARLAARVGIQIFFTAYGLWLEAGDGADIATISARTLALLAMLTP